MMRHILPSRRYAVLVLALVSAGTGFAGCGEAPEGDGGTAGGKGDGVAASLPPVQNPLGFEVWRKDFPIAVRLSPRQGGKWYTSSRRQALEKVVANLQGNTSKHVWHMAKEFFWHAPKDAVEPLIEAMDRAYQQGPAYADLVTNCVEAMGKMADPAFDAALQRALEHKSKAVRNAAFAALGRSGTPETVRKSFAYFGQMDGRARNLWLRAARLRLSAEAAPYFQQLLLANLPPQVHSAVLDEVLEMEPEVAAELLRPLWPRSVGRTRAEIAGVLHAAGDGAGTAHLQSLLRGTDSRLIVVALQQLRGSDLEPLMDDALKLSIHQNPDVRLALVGLIEDLPGENISNTLEVLADPNEAWPVKSSALRALTRRGRVDQVHLLLAELPTATGTRMQLILNLLSASGANEAVPVFMERFRKAPPGEGRPFLQALAFSGASQAFDALGELFLDEERLAAERSDGSHLTTLNYIPTLMPNVRGVEPKMVEFFRAIDKADYRRRALMAECIAGVANDRQDSDLDELVHGTLWEIVFDRTEIPQMRLAALNLMSRHATIDVALRLKAAMAEEEMPMRKAFGDFLLEYF